MDPEGTKGDRDPFVCPTTCLALVTHHPPPSQRGPTTSQAPCVWAGLHLENEAPNTILGRHPWQGLPTSIPPPGKGSASEQRVVQLSEKKRNYRKGKGFSGGSVWKVCGVENRGNSTACSARREHSDSFWSFLSASAFRIPLSLPQALRLSLPSLAHVAF